MSVKLLSTLLAAKDDHFETFNGMEYYRSIEVGNTTLLVTPEVVNKHIDNAKVSTLMEAIMIMIKAP